jgi:hypothetical protein
MAYTTVEGRQQLLGALAEAIDEIGLALASLSAAYERLDIATADTLEEELFGPAQRAYGRAKRTHVEFAERQWMAGRVFEPQSAGVPSTGSRASSTMRLRRSARPVAPGRHCRTRRCCWRWATSSCGRPHVGEGADRRDHPPEPASWCVD